MDPGTRAEEGTTEGYASVRYSARHSADDEETPLLGRQTVIDGSVAERHYLSKQRKIYAAVTLADVFQKIVWTAIIANFMLFAETYLDSANDKALVIYFVFSICAWITCATVNLFVEHWMSRRSAITLGFCIYVLGMAILTGLTVHMYSRRPVFRLMAVTPLYLICVGEGLCKTAIGEFGQKQFQDSKLSPRLQAYASRLYWVGHTCALIVIAFILGLEQLASFGIGYGLCCVLLFVGFISFALGWKSFRKPQKRKQKNPLRLLLAISRDARHVRAKLNMNLSSSVTQSADTVNSHVESWLDYAKVKFGGTYDDADVDEAKSLIKMGLVFLTFVPYWTCNAQGYSMFIFQGIHLNAAVGSATVPVSWITLVNIVAVLFCVPLLEKGLYPWLRRKGYSFPTSWRIIVGMVTVVISMCFAGLVQWRAYSSIPTYGIIMQEVGRKNVTAVAGVHILWTIPQFVFLGISEIFVGLTGLGLACKLCPRNFQKVVTSLHYLAVAMGNVVSVVVLSAGWFPSSRVMEGNTLMIYFFALAAWGLLGIFLFLFISPALGGSTQTSIVNRERFERQRRT